MWGKCPNTFLGGSTGASEAKEPKGRKAYAPAFRQRKWSPIGRTFWLRLSRSAGAVSCSIGFGSGSFKGSQRAKNKRNDKSGAERSAHGGEAKRAGQRIRQQAQPSTQHNQRSSTTRAAEPSRAQRSEAELGLNDNKKKWRASQLATPI